jgi:hypothetical protein
MEVKHHQINNLATRLPKLELSYETVVHKKVSSIYDICISIPTGKRQFAWFSYDEDGDVCYLMDLTKEMKINRITQINTEFSQPLSLGTILYGTMCEINGLQFFVIDDIYYYKGIYIKSLTFGEKMTYLIDVVSNYVSPEFKNISSVVFKLACMETSLSNVAELIESQSFYETQMSRSAYNSHHIQFRSTTQIMPYLNHTYKNKTYTATASIEPQIFIPRNDLDFGAAAYKSEAVFRVMADIQSDIYLLYAYNEGIFEFYDIAYIGSRKESVFMNSLFRNVRENSNIDYGEESEDEDMFQNTNIDKYVDLKREYKMSFSFHHKFKKWVPIRTVDAKTKCVNISQLIRNSNNNSKPYSNNNSSTNNYSNNNNSKPYSNNNYSNNNNSKPYSNNNYSNNNNSKPYSNNNYSNNNNSKPYSNNNYSNNNNSKPYSNNNNSKPYSNNNNSKPYSNNNNYKPPIPIAPVLYIPCSTPIAIIKPSHKQPLSYYNRERKL